MCASEQHHLGTSPCALVSGGTGLCWGVESEWDSGAGGGKKPSNLFKGVIDNSRVP